MAPTGCMVVPVEPGLHATMGSVRAPELQVETLPMGATSRVRVELLRDDGDKDLFVTTIVVRGEHPGPIFGVVGGVRYEDGVSTRLVEQWIEQLRVADLHGTVVAVPTANVLGRDIEHTTEVPTADLGEVYMHRLCARVVGQLDALVELRAPVGDIEELPHVRAQLDDPTAARLAELQHPSAVVDERASPLTLLGSAQRLGMTAITVAIGNADRSDGRSRTTGLHDALCHLRMQPALESPPPVAPTSCHAPQWITVDAEASIESIREVGTFVDTGQALARLRRHDVHETMRASYPCIVLARRAGRLVPARGRVIEIASLMPDAHVVGAQGPARRGSDPRNDQNEVYRARSS